MGSVLGANLAFLNRLQFGKSEQYTAAVSDLAGEKGIN